MLKYRNLQSTSGKLSGYPEYLSALSRTLLRLSVVEQPFSKRLYESEEDALELSSDIKPNEEMHLLQTPSVNYSTEKYKSQGRKRRNTDLL